MRRKFHELYSGWKMLALIWMIYFLVATIASYGASALFTHMVDWGLMEQSTVGLATTVRSCANMILSVPASILIQKIGARFTIMLGAGISAAACLLYSLFQMPAWLFLTIFAVLGGSMVFAATVSASIYVNDWFNKRKALAQAILLTAGTTGGIVIPPLVNLVYEWSGWRSCWLLFFMMALLGLFLTLVFLRNKPEDVGEVKDGHLWLSVHYKPEEISAAAKVVNDPAPVKKLVASKEFFVMGVMVFCNRIVFSAGVAYLTLHALVSGFAATEAALCLSVFSFAALIGRFLPAFVDRMPVPIHVDNAVGFLVQGMGAAVLALTTIPVLFVPGCLLLGFGTGFTYGVFPIALPKYFCSVNFGAVFGIQNAIGYAAGVLSPPVFMLVDLYSGGYWIGYGLIALLSLLCVLLSLGTPANPERFAHRHIYDGHDKHGEDL